MGAAFERGFTQGLLGYRDQRLSEVNSSISETIIEKLSVSANITTERLKELEKGIVVALRNASEEKYQSLVQKLYSLKKEKGKLENLQIEMVVDLSSHQIDYTDPNAQASYYMTAGEENMNPAERKFVEEKAIKGANNLGRMRSHHSSGAEPSKLPSAAKRDQKPK